MPQTDQAAPLLHRLAALPSTLPYRQKIADARDFADPRMDLICREAVGSLPRLRARLWEATRVFDLLADIGALRPDSVGLGIASGREKVLFAIANACSHLTVTDLYSGTTSWKSARTEDPSRFVLANAPPGFDARRITVRNMDARRLDFPDASFDFAYSVSSFEHFGMDPDFLDHLREVRRVLKPGGAYVLTTEMRFGPATVPVRGNHAFALGHLLRLVAEAGLTAEPVIDARLARVAENEPRQYAEVRQFGVAELQDMVLMHRDNGGVASVPVVLVLKPGPGPAPDVIGLDDTIRWMTEAQRNATARRYSDWVRLNPFMVNQAARGAFCELFDPQPPNRGPVFGTTYVAFGDALIEARVTVVGSEAEETAGTMTVAVNEWGIEDISALRQIHSVPLDFGAGRGQARQAVFTFPAREGYRYCILGLASPGSRFRLALADVLVRRARS